MSIKQTTKKDEYSKKIYKLLITLHTDFSELINLIENTGSIQREIRELEDQIDNERQQNVKQKLEQITKDLEMLISSKWKAERLVFPPNAFCCVLSYKIKNSAPSDGSLPFPFRTAESRRNKIFWRKVNFERYYIIGLNISFYDTPCLPSKSSPNFSSLKLVAMRKM